MNEFITLVQEMRTAQKQYFKSREYSDLQKSLALEKRVDKAIENHFTPSLF